MIEATAIVQNEMGIHCRPSAVILKKAADYPGTIKVVTPAGECALNSVMGLMALGLEKGTELTIQVTGPDERETCRKMVELFQTHFDFPPRTEGGNAPARKTGGAPA